jgi:hypothetical protein
MVVNVRHIDWDKLDALATNENASISGIISGLIKFYEESEGEIKVK